MEQSLEQVVELVANLDDVTGEQVAAAVEALLAEGALDAWSTPIIMKQGRPGVMLSVLCADDARDRLMQRVIELTGTFGVRHRTWDRLVLHRQHHTVDTIYGPIRIKVGRLDDHIAAVKCEFADVRKAAEAHDVSPRRVQEAAHVAIEQWRKQQGGRT